MTQHSEALQQARHLAERLHAIAISSNTGVFGVSGTDTALLALRRAAAELVRALQTAAEPVPQLERLQALEAALQSARLVGLLSEIELADYLRAVDNLYDLTDKEL